MLAVYVRVSSDTQSHLSQRQELLRWLRGQLEGAEALALIEGALSSTVEREGVPVDWPSVAAWGAVGVRWYFDTWSGVSMDAPQLDELLDCCWRGEAKTVVIWRLDRLGRSALGLHQLYEAFALRGISLVSVRDGLDFASPTGRLLAGLLASIGAYETEVRRERQMAGIAARRAAGKKWGGSKPGPRAADPKVVRTLREQGYSGAEVAKALGIGLSTVKRFDRAAKAATRPTA